MYRNKIWNTKFMMLFFFRAVGTEFSYVPQRWLPDAAKEVMFGRSSWESQTQCQILANQEGLIHRKTMLQPSHLPIVWPGLMSTCQKSLRNRETKGFQSQRFLSNRICRSVRLRWWNPNASCNSRAEDGRLRGAAEQIEEHGITGGKGRCRIPGLVN